MDKFLVELQAQLDDKRVQLHVDDEAKVLLAERGYDDRMGARPMSRLIQEVLKKPLAEEILFGELTEGGGDVHVYVKDGEIKYDVEKVAVAEAD